ncbi:type II secretion system protein [Phascolarctobacterium sp.]
MDFYRKMFDKKGFTLIELVAVTAMLGILAGMLLPSIDSANKRAKNAKLYNDLLTVDSAIQLYKMENGKCPRKLEELVSDYIAKNKGFTDAMGETFKYDVTDNSLSYTLTGADADGKAITSDGSKQ